MCMEVTPSITLPLTPLISPQLSTHSENTQTQSIVVQLVQKIKIPITPLLS